MNDSIQGLAHRVRLLENQIEYKSKKDKRKIEFKAEKKKKNYEKAFQISLELKPKYMIQILKKFKENDYQLVSVSKFENSIEILFNDLDEIVNDFRVILLFITNVVKYCKTSINLDLKNKIIAHCNELLSLKEEYHLSNEDIELTESIINSMSEK